MNRLAYLPLASLALCSIFCADFSDPSTSPIRTTASTGSPPPSPTDENGQCPGTPCKLAGASARCENSACVVDACNSGRGNCDGDPNNGCEANTQTSPEHCGACGKPCGNNQVCNAGTCATSCDGGRSQCGSSCVDLQSDVTNCGTCGKSCEGGASCNKGVCITPCGPGFSACAEGCCTTSPTGPRRVSGEGGHTCAVTPSGRIKCWGSNAFGALGQNSIGGVPAAPGFVVGITGGAIAVAAGMSHVCAVVSAGIRCWGRNHRGQLGNADTADSSVSVAARGLTQDAVDVAAGSWFSCGLTSVGEVRCWGDNQKGQLGNTTVTESSSIPVVVTGLTSVKAIDARTNRACALKSNGDVWCWGDNSYGQAGPFPLVEKTPPTKVPLPGSATRIATGDYHTCALLQDETVSCWGDNSVGQVGQSNLDVYSPTAVSGLAGVIDIGAGFNHSCAALRSGEVRCWGENSLGQLGSGNIVSSKVPVTVVNLTAAAPTLGMGGQHTCLGSSMGIQCWGANQVSQLGDGTTTNRSVPGAVINFP
jgi:alpha-tubulin suppressor-like RCC1 family protein